MSENRGDTPERRGPQTEPAKDDIGETGEQRITQPEPTKPSTPTPSDEGVVWVRFAPSQVVRTVVIALLSAAVVLGALFLLWQVRTIIGWAVLALFLAAVLNPAVNWLERRRIKRSFGIVLTYLGVVVGLLLVLGIFVPVVYSEIRDLIDFFVGVSQSPGGSTEYLRTSLEQIGLGSLFNTLSERLADLPSQLAERVEKGTETDLLQRGPEVLG